MVIVSYSAEDGGADLDCTLLHRLSLWNAYTCHAGVSGGTIMVLSTHLTSGT